MKTSIFLVMLFGISMIFSVATIPNADAAVDMFMKLGTIKGESQDSKHKDEIDVLAWSWGMSNSGTTHTSGGAGAGKANFQDISFTKYVDKSSTSLMLAAARGDHFVDGKLTNRSPAAKSPVEFLTYEFKDILVTSFQTGGSGGEDRLTENITLNFAEIKATYTPTNPDGSAGTPSIFNWNIATNAPGS